MTVGLVRLQLNCGENGEKGEGVKGKEGTTDLMVN